MSPRRACLVGSSSGPEASGVAVHCTPPRPLAGGASSADRAAARVVRAESELVRDADLLRRSCIGRRLRTHLDTTVRLDHSADTGQVATEPQGKHMNLQDICEETVADVEGCLGCAVVDLETGLPLAINVAAGSLLGDEAMELLAAACTEYFRGRMVWQLQLTLSGGEPAVSFVHEIQTTTEDTYNFMSVVPGRENAVLVLILDKAANLGLGRMSMRQVLRRLSESNDVYNNAPPESPARLQSVVTPSAFAREQSRAKPVAPMDAGESRPGSATHVPYRDVSAADEVGGRSASRSPEHTGRPWRGLGGRHGA